MYEVETSRLPKQRQAHYGGLFFALFSCVQYKESFYLSFNFELKKKYITDCVRFSNCYAHLQ